MDSRKRPRPSRVQKFAGLLVIRPVAEIQRERLEPGRAEAELAHDMIRHEKNRPAVNAAGKRHADGFMRRNPFQPLGDFVRQRADVTAADVVEVGRKRVALRREVARVGRVGIGTADELDFHHVMRRHHARVAGMKLPVQSLGLELVENGVNAVGHDQRRAFGALGQEVTHRAVHRTRHADGLALAREQRERAVNLAHRLGLAGKDALARLIEAQVVDLVEGRVEQVNHAFDVFVHDRSLQKIGCGFHHSNPIAAR